MFLLISIIMPCVFAFPDPGTKESEVPKLRNKTDPARSVWKDCSNGIFNPACVKIGAITLLEGLNNKDELHLLPGVSVVKETSAAETAEEVLAFAKSLPVEDKLDKFFIYRLGNYLDTHSLRLKLVDENVMREARSMVGEARRKDPLGGKKGGLGVILAMAMMMKGTLMSIGIGGLAMLAGKALMTAMMSLLLSAIIGIKSLTSGGKSTTYEIVSKPVYSHSHSTGHEEIGGYAHSPYGRSMKTTRR